MTQDPAAVATGNNPLLTTLTSAAAGKLKPGVNLVDIGLFTAGVRPVTDANRCQS